MPPECRLDPSVRRVVINGFQFPLGVYPVEEMVPAAGYVMNFESADGGRDDEDDDAPEPWERGAGERKGAADDDEDEGRGGSGGPGVSGGSGPSGGGGGSGSGDNEWEEWPDRYVFDAVVSAERVETLFRSLIPVLPLRVYPILDVLGNDAYREIDPYVSYDLVGLDRFLECVRRFRPLFFEDGMCGFGCMSEEPFVYLFIDEHKIVTVRAEPALKERIERSLRALDLEPADEPAGADAAAHEHRSVLDGPNERDGVLGVGEIVEILRDEWRLVLNVDPEKNVDDKGEALGVTYWRCVVRYEVGTGDRGQGRRYAEVFLAADCLRAVEELALEAVADEVDRTLPAPPAGERGKADTPPREAPEESPSDSWGEADVVVSDRVRADAIASMLPPGAKSPGKRPSDGTVYAVRLLD